MDRSSIIYTQKLYISDMSLKFKNQHYSSEIMGVMSLKR